MADRKISQLPAAESGDLVDTSLMHLVNTLQPDAAQRNRKLTLAQARVYFGEFSGPASSTGDNLVAFDGTTGKIAKDSGVSTASVTTAITQAGNAISPFLLMGA
jgi:hypothetical protein